MSSVLSSVKWNFITSILRRIITFVLFLFIAHIFDRAQLGVYREYALIISFFAGISLFSTPTLYIVEKDNSVIQRLAPAVLVLTFLIGILLSFLAPLFAKYYNSDILIPLLRFSLPILLIEVLRQYLRAIYQKQMEFKYLSIIETLNVIFYSALALLIIPFVRDIKLFIAIFYAGNLLELVLLINKRWKKPDKYLIQFTKNIKAKVIHSFSCLIDHIHFLFFSSTATTINMLLLELPVLILGLYFAPEHIGNYFIAFQLVMVPSGLITMSLSQVFFSKFSQIKAEEYKEKLDRLYNIEFDLLIPSFLIYVLLIREWVMVLFGAKDIFEIKLIVLLLFLRSMSAFIMNPISSFFAILKKPQIEFYWSVTILVLSNLLVFLFRNSVFTTVLSVFIISSVLFYISFNWLVFRHIKYSNRIFNKKILLLFYKLLLITCVWFVGNFYLKQLLLNKFILLGLQCLYASVILLVYFIIKNYLFKAPILKELKVLLGIRA